MAERKTIDEYDIEGKYEPGWEVLTTEATHFRARDQIKLYREAEPGIAFRIKKHRVKKDSVDLHYLLAHDEEVEQSKHDQREARRMK
jgi:hypothetical protein